MAANTARGMQEIGAQLLKPPASAFARGGRGGPPPFSAGEIAVMERGQAIYKEVCFACHGDDGRGAVAAGAPAGTTMAPSLASSSRVQGHRDYVIKTLLHGMDGPIDGRSYAGGVMAPMGTNRDEWIADIGSYVRNSFGNVGPFISQADVARVRAATAGRTAFWKVDELVASLPAALEPAGVEGDGQSQRRRGDRRARISRDGRQARRSSRACGSRSSCRTRRRSPRSSSFAGRRSRRRRSRTRWTRRPWRCWSRSARWNSRAGGAPPADSAVPIAPPAAPAPGSVGNHARAYKVDVSADGSTWITVSEGQGAAGSTTIAFAPVTARFVRITQTGAVENAPPWSMQRLRLFAAGK